MKLALALTVAVAGCGTATVNTPGSPSAAPGMKRWASANHTGRPHLSRSSRSQVRGPIAAPWPALARCESGGNPRAVDSSGQYFGLYQFDVQTWAAVGGHGLPSDASPPEQTMRAEQLYAERGAAPWPICGWHLEGAA